MLIRNHCLGPVCLAVILLGIFPGKTLAVKTHRHTAVRNAQKHRTATTKRIHSRLSNAREAALKRYLASRGLRIARVIRGARTSAFATGDGSAGKWTASHTTVCHGAIAASPGLFKRGTKLIVAGYGYGLVRDIGDDIKGKRLDLGLNSPGEADIYGRQIADVYEIVPIKKRS